MITVIKWIAIPIYKFLNELASDFAIAKVPIVAVILMDYFDVLNKVYSMFNIDMQFSWWALSIVVLDSASGATSAAGKGEFSFKKLGEGFAKKVWKWGRAILLVAILKNFTVSGEVNEIYSKIDLIIFTFIMTVEGDSVSNHVFKFKISDKINTIASQIKSFKPKKDG